MLSRVLMLSYCLVGSVGFIWVAVCVIDITWFLGVIQVQSEFQKAYEKGIHKSKWASFPSYGFLSQSSMIVRLKYIYTVFRFWEPTYEDSLNLIARVPIVAAYVYRRSVKCYSYPGSQLDLNLRILEYQNFLRCLL